MRCVQLWWCWWNQLPDVFHRVGDKSEAEPLQRTQFLLQPSSVEISSGIFTFNTSHSHVELLQRLVFLVGKKNQTSPLGVLTTRRASVENALRMEESASELCSSHVANAGWDEDNSQHHFKKVLWWLKILC